MSNVYDILTRAIPNLPADIQAEAKQALDDFHTTQSLYDRLGLTPIEFRIYQRLAESPGTAVPYKAILTAAKVENKASLWVHKRRLLIKLRPIGKTINSKLGIGYSLDDIDA